MKASPSKVLEGVRESLKVGGVFAAEMGGFLNCVGVRSALHVCCRKRGLDPDQLDPWFFPTPKHYSQLAEAAGLQVTHCELVPRPTPLPASSGIKGWLRTFAGPFLNAFPSDEEKEETLQEVEDMLRPDCYDADEDVWTVMYVRLRIRAVRKS